MTLTICATFKLERLTGPLLVSILMITLGTGVATAVEVGVAGFAWPGFFCFLFSTLMEAVRVVYIQLLLGKMSYSSMEVCHHRLLSNDVVPRCDTTNFARGRDRQVGTNRCCDL